MIQLDYKDTRSIYEQIEQGLRQLIITGALKADTQIPSVRELSATLTVNPNTVQRAYKALETSGFIYSIKGRGNFVSQMHAEITDPRKNELMQEMTKIIGELKYLGVTEKNIADTVRKIYEEEE